MLPKLMTDGAELSYFLVKSHGGTPVFSLRSDIGSYAACMKPLAHVSICCEGTLLANHKAVQGPNKTQDSQW